MKKYLLFGFDEFYPSGGLNDLICMFDSVPEAIDGYLENVDNDFGYDKFQVFNTSSGQKNRINMIDLLSQYEVKRGRDLDMQDRAKLRLDFLKSSIEDFISVK